MDRRRVGLHRLGVGMHWTSEHGRDPCSHGACSKDRITRGNDALGSADAKEQSTKAVINPLSGLEKEWNQR